MCILMLISHTIAGQSDNVVCPEISSTNTSKKHPTDKTRLDAQGLHDASKGQDSDFRTDDKPRRPPR